MSWGARDISRGGTCPREEPGPWWGLQEDDLCPSSGAGLVLKQKLNLIHCQCRCSFKRNAAFTAEDTGAISPRQHLVCTSHHQPSCPPKGWADQLSLTDVARHPAASQSPWTTAPAWIYTQLHPDFQPALAQGDFGAALGCQLCDYPLPRRL